MCSANATMARALAGRHALYNCVLCHCVASVLASFLRRFLRPSCACPQANGNKICSCAHALLLLHERKMIVKSMFTVRRAPVVLVAELFGRRFSQRLHGLLLPRLRASSFLRSFRFSSYSLLLLVGGGVLLARAHSICISRARYSQTQYERRKGRRNREKSRAQRRKESTILQARHNGMFFMFQCFEFFTTLSTRLR